MVRESTCTDTRPQYTQQQNSSVRAPHICMPRHAAPVAEVFEVKHKRWVAAKAVATIAQLDERTVINRSTKPVFRDCRCKITPGLLEIDDTPESDVMKLVPIAVPLIPPAYHHWIPG